MKYNAISLIIVFCLCLVSTGCQTTPPAIALEKIKGTILDYGTYKKETDEGLPWVNPVSTNSIVYEGGKKHSILERTNKMQAIIGRGFTLRYQIEGLPDGNIPLDWTVAHPPMRKPNGELSSGYSYSRPITVIDGVSKGQVGYFFESSYELVEGDWTFSYSYQGQPVININLTTFLINPEQASKNSEDNANKNKSGEKHTPTALKGELLLSKKNNTQP